MNARAQLTVLLVPYLLCCASPSRANELQSPPDDSVVRLQGADLTVGGTGTLIGAEQVGSNYLMVIIGPDHTYERDGPITSVGFGNLGSPLLNLTSFTSFSTILAPTISGQGPVDMALYEVSVNLSSLTAAQQSFLTGVAPVTVTTAPSSPGYNFTGIGYGSDNVVTTAYGTQLQFQNTVTGYLAFSGSYTTDKSGNPLNYTESLASWTTQASPGLGACVSGCSGSPLFLDSGLTQMAGYQVNGSLVAGGTNYGVEFTPQYVSWIDGNSTTFLAPTPLPSSGFLFGAGALALGLMLRVKRPDSLEAGLFNRD